MQRSLIERANWQISMWLGLETSCCYSELAVAVIWPTCGNSRNYAKSNLRKKNEIETNEKK